MTRPVTLAALILALAAGSSPAQDRPNSMPGPPGPDAKVAANPPAAARALTEDDVEAIVERVLARSIARQAVRGSAPPPEGWQPPAAVASSQYQGPVAAPYPSAQSYPRPATQTVAVLVPAGPIGSALGRLGSHAAKLGQPRVRTFRVASAAFVQSPPPTYASGQQP